MGYPATTEVRRRPRRVLSTWRVAVAALAVVAYYCFYSDVAMQFLGMEQEEEQRNETRSFLLPLYPKARQERVLREFGDVKLAARRVDDGGRKAKNKMEVARAAMAGTNSTALLPIKGNVFSDGAFKIHRDSSTSVLSHHVACVLFKAFLFVQLRPNTRFSSTRHGPFHLDGVNAEGYGCV